MQTDILIAGAGLSGLTLAGALAQAGVSCLLAEARGRVGGRVLTIETSYDSIGVTHADIGPSWIWPGQTRIARLLQRLDLGVFEQYSAGRLVYEDELARVRRDLDYSTMAGSLRVDGGIGRLPRALAAHLPAGILHLSQPVTRIQRLDKGYAISLGHGADQLEVKAHKVVLAIPPRVIARQIAFTPALPARVMQDLQSIPTWMAGHAKLFALYPTPFWRASGLSGSAVSHVGPLMEVHDASDDEGRQAALFGFVGVPALSRRHMGPQALIDAAVAQLARLFGSEALAPQAVHLQDWADEAETATPADAQPALAHPAPMSTALPAPWRDRIHLAGSEFAPDFPGYLEGAVRAAELAVHALQAQLRTDAAGAPAGAFD